MDESALQIGVANPLPNDFLKDEIEHQSINREFRLLSGCKDLPADVCRGVGLVWRAGNSLRQQGI